MAEEKRDEKSMNIGKLGWYIIHTYSGYENKVEQNIRKVVENRGLQDKIQQVLIPIQKVEEINGSKKQVIDHKIFPGYVMVKMVYTEETWAVVRNTRGVTGFVGPGSVPTPLTATEVAKMGIELPVEKVTEVSFKVGDRVRITSDSMNGYIAVVESIDIEKDEVEAIVQMFGRSTKITLPLEQVEKYED